MRVTHYQQSRNLSSQMMAAQSAVAAAQHRALTGKKWEKASENTFGAGYVLQSSRLKDRLEGMGQNFASSKEHLTLVESSLDEMTKLISQARQIGLQGNNSTLSAEERKTLATQIESLAARAVDLANTTDSEGLGIYSGQSREPEAFKVDGTTGALHFTGDELPRQMELRPGEWTRMNMENSGSFFAELHAELKNLKAAIENGSTTEALVKIEAKQKQVLDVRSTMGVRLQQVEKLAAQHEARVDDLTGKISDAQEIDLSEAITEYQRANLVYSAALQFTAQAQQLGLMDFLR